ncbi:DUF3817 domain-containing protein [Pseudoflavitalea sp. G-6-1-2]|uniref:DUF3817 domain-containing protein n=1 Tax=Pseudoflavitalea sp. G-6-1-2 TaxID=2728841 RepID=UPI00146EBE94|nr:DUF3817 domain-containing protein [Pseudoflavitalea sp. G-6-1-2]NML20930.1 DUF3817 domain-containing protein [Pseudoflavitalea sp. G-6-1-2]
MASNLNSGIGRLRLTGLLEGISYLLLLFIAVPAKYWADMPIISKVLGPIHGVLFVMFVYLTISIASEKKWGFATTGKLLLASIIPFGTFYVDSKILRPAQEEKK